MWHEEWGFPYKMEYLTDQTFYESGNFNTDEDIPTHYRMWGEDMIIEQLRSASVLRIYSSATTDTSIQVCVFGMVAGFPDYEIITTNASNGTTAVSGSKSFQSVERVVKYASSTGRITVDANSASTLVSVLPVGDTTAGIMYRKVQLYPLPSTIFDMNVQYYKDVYRLVNDNDVHELGQDFDEAIILLSVSKLKGEAEIVDGTKTFFSMWQDEMSNLKKINAEKIDWFPHQERPKESVLSSGRIHKYLNARQIGSHYGGRSYF
jgi:hypothetical protein